MTRKADHREAFMSMEQRHAMAIASIIAGMWDTAERDSIAAQLAVAFANNPTFDREAFYEACGKED